MGCVGGSEASTPHTTMYSSKSPIIENLSEKSKDKLSSLIQKDDILALAVAMHELNALPNSQISDSHMRWMTIHLCCRWDADNCLQYLLKDYFIHNPKGYIDFVNAPTVEGYTCLHLCALWKSEKCFHVLHAYGGLSLNAKDKSLRTAQETAVNYRCKKMQQILTTYKQMNINFTHIETEKLVSRELLAQDIGTQLDKKQKQKEMNNGKAQIQKNKQQVLQQMSEIQKAMIEEKKKLQKEKEEILKEKVEREKKAQEEKKKLIQEDRKKQTEDNNRLEQQKIIKQRIDEQVRKNNQKVAAELKAKQEELNRVKMDLKRAEQERIKKEKDDAQKKAEEFIKLKEQELKKMSLEKDQAIANLKKQQQEKAKLQQEQANKNLKEIEQNYNNKFSQLNKKLEQKQNEVQRMKKEEEQRLNKQRGMKLSEEAFRKAEADYQQKLKQKEQQIRRIKQLQTQRLKQEKAEAQKKALEQKPVQNTQNTQNVQKKQNPPPVNQNSNSTSPLKEAFAKIKEQVPPEIQKLYLDAKARGAFFDSEFPANNSSIGDSSKANFSNFTTNTVWLRPKDFLKGGFQLFNGIDPNDIKQGSLGVCYMLASISALAETPKYIERMFTFADTALGFYVLRFYINGKPKNLLVDDLIPCNKTTKSPLFTKPIGNQVWVLLVEKAWSKAIGSYLNAEAMTPDHMMQDLTSSPSFGSWFDQTGKSNAKHIETIVRHSKMNHLVVVTSGEKKIQGIANNHAYSLLDAYQYNGRNIFKIRNPWGNFEWNGEYGATSSLWTPELKKLVNFQDADNGVFHISENQLTDAYCYYSISQVNQVNLYSFQQFSSKANQDIFYRVKITKKADINFRVTQLFDRMTTDKSYKYSPLVFEVGKINANNTVTFISEGHSKSYFGAKSVHAFENAVQSLEAGDYFIRIRMLWVNDSKYNTAVFGVYAPEAIKVEKLDSATGLSYLKSLLVSFGANTKKNPTGDGFYKILTMKGQFVFVGETQKQGNYSMKFTFTQNQMKFCETDIGKISGNVVEVQVNKNSPGVATARRTQPANGGTTGPVSIEIRKA